MRQLPHLGDTPYQQDTIMVTYASNPERALTLLDSALLLGNISDYRSQFIRAKIYCKSLMEQQQDSLEWDTILMSSANGTIEAPSGAVRGASREHSALQVRAFLVRFFCISGLPGIADS